MLARTPHHFHHELPIRLAQPCQPRAELYCLIVRLARAFRQQLAHAHPQASAELFHRQQRGQHRPALEARDRLRIHAHPLGRCGLTNAGPSKNRDAMHQPDLLPLLTTKMVWMTGCC
jgi:hypothetical protein